MATRLLIDHRTGTGATRRRRTAPTTSIQRKPDWIRVKAPNHPVYHETRAAHARQRPRHRLRGSRLPQHRRVLVPAPRHHDDHGRHLHPRLQPSATSVPACRTRWTPSEPARVAAAVARLGLRHVVITSVDRDDLPDGGAAALRGRHRRHPRSRRPLNHHRGPHPRLPPQAWLARGRRPPPARTSSTTTSRPSRASTPPSAPAPATTSPSACSTA